MKSVITVPLSGGMGQAFMGDDSEEAMDRIATGPQRGSREWSLHLEEDLPAFRRPPSFISIFPSFLINQGTNIYFVPRFGEYGGRNS